jgi:D-glycero-alpha-D-manno-heptose-7-phosphate kinase
MDKKVESVSVKPRFSIKKTMEIIDRSGLGVALAIDETGAFLGVITDGDIRRALLKDRSLSDKIGGLIKKDPVTLHTGYTRHHVLRLFSEFGKRIKHIPVLDGNNRVTELLSYTDYFELKDNHNDLVIRAKAPLRISFAGGGTDVNQYMKNSTGVVLSTTINKYCYGTLRRRADSRIMIHSSDYDAEIELPSLEKIKFDGKLDLVKAVLKIMKPNYGLELYLKSDVPPGTGLGGSSSIAAVIIGLLNYFRAEKLDEYQIAEMAYQAERIELNVSGGWQDQYAAVFGGFNFMEFTKDDVVVHPLKIKPGILNELEYHLLLCFTGKTRNSGEIVKRQTSSFVAGNKDVIGAFENIRVITYAMKNAILKGELYHFADLLHEAWEEKKKFDSRITNKQINELYEIGRKAGAIGGKVLGAGGGGYILFFCADRKKENIEQRLCAAGGEIMNFNFDFHGLQTWEGSTDAKDRVNV